MIENKPLISYPKFNIALFIAYLIYLYFNNRFYTVYAHELKKAHFK